MPISALSLRSPGLPFQNPQDPPASKPTTLQTKPQSAPAPQEPLGLQNDKKVEDRRLAESELPGLATNDPVFFHRLKDKGNVHFVRAGNPTGKTILLVSGIPDQLYTFHRLIPLLAKAGFDVIAIDALGRGQSIYEGEAEKFTPEFYVAFWQQMFKDLKLKDVSVVAFSAALAEMNQAAVADGISISQIIPLDGWDPSILPRKIVEGSDAALTQPYGRTFYGSVGIGMTKTGLEKSFHGLKKDECEKLATAYMKGWPPGSRQKGENEKPEAYDAWKKRNTLWLHGISKTITYQYALNSGAEAYAAAAAPRWERLKRIPYTFISGAEDHMLQLEGDEAKSYPTELFTAAQGKLGEQIKHVVIPGAGHMVPIEKPQELCDQLVKIVKPR